VTKTPLTNECEPSLRPSGIESYETAKASPDPRQGRPDRMARPRRKTARRLHRSPTALRPPVSGPRRHAASDRRPRAPRPLPRGSAPAGRPPHQGPSLPVADLPEKPPEPSIQSGFPVLGFTGGRLTLPEGQFPPTWLALRCHNPLWSRPLAESNLSARSPRACSA